MLMLYIFKSKINKDGKGKILKTESKLKQITQLYFSEYHNHYEEKKKEWLIQLTYACSIWLCNLSLKWAHGQSRENRIQILNSF